MNERTKGAGGTTKGTEMTRNLKTIVLALLAAAVALSTLASAGAFAEEEEEAEGGSLGTLTAAGYPAILDGTDIAGELNAFTLGGKVIKCPKSTYTGEIEGETPAFTIFPTYSNCTETGSNVNATVQMNGCGYKLTLRKTTIQGTDFVDNYFFTADVICPSGKDIEVIVYKAANENAESCKFTIEEQPLPDRGKLQNVLEGGTTNGELKLERQLENIVATQSGPDCGSKKITNGKYHMNIGIKGTTNKGGPNFLAVTDGE